MGLSTVNLGESWETPFGLSRFLRCKTFGAKIWKSSELTKVAYPTKSLTLELLWDFGVSYVERAALLPTPRVHKVLVMWGEATF